MIFKNSLLSTVKPWFCLSSSDVKSDSNIYFWAAFWYTPNKFVIYLLYGSRKYPYHPLQKGSDFQGGVNLPNLPVGRGVHHREIFPEGSCDAQESN